MPVSSSGVPESPLLHEVSLVSGLSSLHRALREKLDPQGLQRREVTDRANKTERDMQAMRRR